VDRTFREEGLKILLGENTFRIPVYLPVPILTAGWHIDSADLSLSPFLTRVAPEYATQIRWLQIYPKYPVSSPLKLARLLPLAAWPFSNVKLVEVNIRHAKGYFPAIRPLQRLQLDLSHSPIKARSVDFIRVTCLSFPVPKVGWNEPFLTWIARKDAEVAIDLKGRVILV